MKLAENYQKAYLSLNQGQKTVVDTIEGPVLVIAGPGVGKTQVLSLRGVEILKQTDTKPANILYLTFTDSAVKNLRKRLLEFVGPSAYSFAIHTFHSLGTEIINQNPENFYFGSQYEPIDELTQIQIITEIVQDLPRGSILQAFHPEHGWTFVQEIVGRISDLKIGGISPSELIEIVEKNSLALTKIDPIINRLFDLDRITQLNKNFFWQCIDELRIILDEQGQSQEADQLYSQYSSYIGLKLAELVTELEAGWNTTTVKTWRDKNCQKSSDGWRMWDSLQLTKFRELALVYKQYQEKMHERGYFDFNDMLLDVVNELKNNEMLRFRYQEQYQYIMVDEFQDTSGVQLQLIQTLINTQITEALPNIMVVGDDDQTIFKFQRASLENIDRFLIKFPKTNVLALTYNYRSRQEILDFAGSIIQNCQIRATTMGIIDKKLVSMRKDG